MLKKTIASLIFILFCLNLSSEEISMSSNKFAFKMYKKMTSEKNLFFSPYSINSVLFMVYSASRENTEIEMQKVMELGDSRNSNLKEMGRLQKEIGSLNSDNIKISTANSAWVKNGFTILESYIQTLTKNLDASFFSADFDDSKKSSNEINRWTEEKTNGLIKNLISPDLINELTRMVLVNAVYFKGGWKKFFKGAGKDIFYAGYDNKVETDMMKLTTRVPYAYFKEFSVIELPYKDNNLSMLVILPENRESMKRFENRIDGNLYNKILSSLVRKGVRVTMPKFKLESSQRLDELLTTLGMNDLFTMRADLSGITGKNNLFVSAVVHKAYIDVNEKGTEAAAATGVVVALKSAGPPQNPIEFKADRPFVFMIKENINNTILFMGKVNNPLK